MKQQESKFQDAVDWYISGFAAFEENLNGGSQLPFHKLRKKAVKKLSENGFPGPRDEEWKYTSVAPILGQAFGLPDAPATESSLEIAPLTFEDADRNLLVFVNGSFSKGLSRLTSQAEGVVVCTLSEALQNHADLVNASLGLFTDIGTGGFTALNTAFAAEGTFIHVPDNVELTDVIHIVHIAEPAKPFVVHPRNLFVFGDNTRASLIETFHGQGPGSYFTNLVSEFIVGDNARVDHLKIQQESTEAFHVSNVNVQQKRDSVFSAVNVDLGGALVRNDVNVELAAEHCETHLFGFYLGSGKQHIDNHTFVDHAMAHCFSNELYKGILDGQSKGVFNGKILVRQDAQKTNALQSNKTLLLTDDASINAKPQLEIFADDVKCTHGATIGQLDDEALFYLRARGISEEMAGAMLRHAFISDVLEGIKLDAVRQNLDAQIIERFTDVKSDS